MYMICAFRRGGLFLVDIAGSTAILQFALCWTGQRQVKNDEATKANENDTRYFL